MNQILKIFLLSVLGYFFGMWLATARAHEGSHYVYGIGHQSNSHTLYAGRTYQWVWLLHARSNVGAIVDSSGLPTRSSSGFGNVQLGLDYERKNVFGNVFFGPGFVTKTDERLSTPHQFFTTVSIGYRKFDYGVHVGYMHISNASTGGPNLGRDFYLIGGSLAF